ncbi:hypothetical protein [Streptomyces viridochromogenes]|uniref:Uncharacterized protein n=1 Tax=Streptomyces viridochromogenes Tue57 TaxID=1160705 RepID=L8PMQ5_STRVR|nr:hypothetical protein [Streptomyces viridochromogenes]ELS58881.1 hypothetical protein STVIR_0134 [Streptomyces viridochromogenes Tue57]
MTNVGRLTDGTDSARARIVLRHGTHAGTPKVVPMVSTSQGSVDDAATRMAGAPLVDQLRRLPGVRMGSPYCGKYAKDGVAVWSTEAEWCSTPVPYCWTYDSVPGAGDWLGTSCCFCSV